MYKLTIITLRFYIGYLIVTCRSCLSTYLFQVHKYIVYKFKFLIILSWYKYVIKSINHCWKSIKLK